MSRQNHINNEDCHTNNEDCYTDNEGCHTNNDDCDVVKPVSCTVEAKTLIPLRDESVKPCVLPANFKPVIKVPAVLAETKIQIVVEANISLKPPAVEIKRVFKDVFLTQCKLVPSAFGEEVCPGIQTVTRAKLFIEGYIRKDIEYATAKCHGVLHDRIATVPFSGFIDLNGHVKDKSKGDFILFPILGKSSESKSRFINSKNKDNPRLDEFFFENSVNYNDQPYCELVRADFFELDLSPNAVDVGDTFHTLREKIVVDLTLKLLQSRQVKVESQGDAK